MTRVLGCEPSDLHKQVQQLVTATSIQNSKIDDLQSQLSNIDALQDHAECNRRIHELELQLDNANAELQSEQQRVDLLSSSIKELRDELQRKGIGQSLEARLRQLGFIDGSRAYVGSSASSTSYRYGSCNGDH
ncbi:hypothetical protein AAVH_12883 [Aphelenchoides avenae]|nr:hypothetical protein AAVH_12883 [Aphelenchus avenae]